MMLSSTEEMKQWFIVDEQEAKPMHFNAGGVSLFRISNHYLRPTLLLDALTSAQSSYSPESVVVCKTRPFNEPV
jgi:hypothetical protein